jgi:hypothetical protein
VVLRQMNGPTPRCRPRQRCARLVPLVAAIAALEHDRVEVAAADKSGDGSHPPKPLVTATPEWLRWVHGES